MPFRLTVSDPGFVAEAFSGAMAAAGHPIEPDSVRPLMGYPKPLAISRLLGDAAESQRIERIHADFVQRMLTCYRSSSGVEPLPDVEAVFATLRRNGIRVALDTGFSRDIADTIVQRLAWQDHIDGLIASDEVPEGRPAPHMIQRLMTQFGIDDPRDVIKVGDTEVDIGEGRSADAGLVVAVTTGAFSRAELEPYAPDHIIDRLQELLALPGLTLPDLTQPDATA